MIVFEGANIISLNYLASRDESLLRYSLQLILSLCTIFQNLESFMNLGLVGKLLKILEGTNIPETFYSNKVKINFKIFFKLTPIFDNFVTLDNLNCIPNIKINNS